MTRTRFLVPSLLLLLEACGTTSGGTVVTDASTTLADAEVILAALEARRTSPTALEIDAGDAIAALGSVLAASSTTPGAAGQTAAIGAAETALRTVASGVPSATVDAAETASLAALSALDAGRGTAAAAEAGAAALLLDALATEGGTQTIGREAAR